MICFGNGTINWEAISAVGTLLASVIALLASWLALKAPEWSKQADRRESTHEVLRATNDALELFFESKKLITEQKIWTDKSVTPLKIRATHLHETINRLISRTSLSDGAIFIGAGAMSILESLRSIETIEQLNETIIEKHGVALTAYSSSIAISKASDSIIAMQEVVDIIHERAERVKQYVKIS